MNSFELELKGLITASVGVATLKNMNDVPVIYIGREGANTITRIHAANTLGMGKVVVEVSGYFTEIITMAEKIRSYSKWW